MSTRKCVVHVHVAEFGQLRRKPDVVRFLPRVETKILQYEDVPVHEFGDGRRRHWSHAVGPEGYLSATKRSTQGGHNDAQR